MLNDFAEGLPHFWVNHKLINQHATGDQYDFCGVHTIAVSAPIQS